MNLGAIQIETLTFVAVMILMAAWFAKEVIADSIVSKMNNKK